MFLEQRAALVLGVPVAAEDEVAQRVDGRGALVQLWVVEKDNTVRLRLVKLGKEIGENVEVLAGLTAGERLVTGGLERVVDGAKIE